MNKSEAAKKRIGATIDIRKKKMSELGKKRWRKMTGEQRSEFAKVLANKRWNKNG